MRELAKAMISFSWAMSLFGIEQLGSVLRETEEEETRSGRMRGALDSVTEATEKGFRERTRSLYDAGDRLQRELVDLVFDMVTSDSLKPERVIDRAAELAEKSADKLREVAKERREETADATA